MAKITQQILFTTDNFLWLRDESVGRKHKNLSQTINELIRNYQYMINAAKHEQEKRQKREIMQIETENKLKSYRNQIINKNL